MKTHLPRDDEALAGVITAVLLLAAVVAFLAMVQSSWLPVWASDDEFAHASAVRTQVGQFADSVETFVQTGLLNRAFERTVTVGAPAVSLPFVGRGSATSGAASVRGDALLVVTSNGTTVGTASGSLTVTVVPSALPAQTYRYALGALEVGQHDGTWVDLRGVVSAQRGSGGKLDLAITAITITGAAQSTSSANLDFASVVTAANNQSVPGGSVRLSAYNVSGDAWRAAIQRVLSQSDLSGETLSDCTLSTRNYCFTSANNTATRVEVTLRNVAEGWTFVSGTARVEVRS